MSGSLALCNRDKGHVVHLRALRSMVISLLREDLPQEHFELGVYLVDQLEITRLNETYLKHFGPTDVITFDYNEPGVSGIAGEIFVSVPQAMEQARQFRTTWQREVVRYIVHGALHLCGYDDDKISSRKRMKRQEDRLVNRLGRRFDFGRVG